MDISGLFRPFILIYIKICFVLTDLKLWRIKKQFSRFLFLVLFQQEIVDLAINDFTMHLLISKWLRIQKCRQEKTMRQRNFQQKCFDSFNDVLDDTSIHFFM